jgi:hypothetical protein
MVLLAERGIKINEVQNNFGAQIIKASFEAFIILSNTPKARFK